MIQYRIDAQPATATNAHLKDMSSVLREVSTTYRLLLETLREQQTYLSSPSIDVFRRHLEAMVSEGVELAEVITDQSQKLVVVCDQANKHLTAFEDRFSKALQKHSAVVDQEA